MTNILSNISTVVMYNSDFILIPFLLPLIVLFILYCSVCGMIVDAAVQKGHERGHLFAICFWLGIPGMIYVASLPDLLARQKADEGGRTEEDDEGGRTEEDDEIRRILEKHGVSINVDA